MRTQHQGNVYTLKAKNIDTGRRKKAKRLHHYTPGATPDVMLSPRGNPDSIPSRTAVPPPSPTSPPLSMGFDDSGSSLDPYKGRSGNTVDCMSEADYYADQMNGLGDGFFSDLFTTAADAYKAQQAAKTAASQAATAQAQAAQAAALKRSSTSLMTGDFLGLTMTTWLMLAGAGLGAYLLLSKKKRR